MTAPPNQANQAELPSQVPANQIPVGHIPVSQLGPAYQGYQAIDLAPQVLDIPPVSPEISQKPWYATTALLVKNVVAMIVALGVIPAAAGDRTTAIVLGLIAFAALAVSEAVVLVKYFSNTRASEEKAGEQRTEQLRLRVEAMRLNMSMPLLSTSYKACAPEADAFYCSSTTKRP